MLRIVKSKANLLFSPVHCRRILAKDPEVPSSLWLCVCVCVFVFVYARFSRCNHCVCGYMHVQPLVCAFVRTWR